MEKRDIMDLRPKVALVLAVISLMAIVWVDISSGAEIRISSWYLIPLLLVTWNINRIWGYFFTLVALAILLGIEPLVGAGATRHIYFYFETVGRFASYLVVISMASKLRQAYDREKRLARTDGLTGLMNRRAFYASIEVEIARRIRNFQPFSLLYLDCDNFKQVNDTLGYNAGDQLLRLLADTLKESVRHGDVVARLGGDEFAIFFPDTNPADIASIMPHLKAALKSAMQRGFPDATLSMGVAIFASIPPNLDEVIMRADQLMYRVKDSGKNGVLQQTF